MRKKSLKMFSLLSSHKGENKPILGRKYIEINICSGSSEMKQRRMKIKNK